MYCNRTIAEDRLYSLEKHLQRRPDVAQKYYQVMEANNTKGYVRKLEPGEIDDGPSWYLPHLPVVREGKETTKVRIVCDSAARYGGVSLNDTMLPGPNLQQDVFDMLLRFRSNPVALVPQFLYEHEDDWPQGKCVVHEERSEECLLLR